MYALFAPLVAQPALAFIPVVGFGALAVATRRPIAWAATGAWALYGLLEAANKARITCSGECNIRIDLLFIVPVLLGLSAFALARIALTGRKR